MCVCRIPWAVHVFPSYCIHCASQHILLRDHCPSHCQNDHLRPNPPQNEIQVNIQGTIFVYFLIESNFQFQHVHFVVCNPDCWLGLQAYESAGVRCTYLCRRVCHAGARSPRLQCLCVPAQGCVPVAQALWLQHVCVLLLQTSHRINKHR